MRKQYVARRRQARQSARRRVLALANELPKRILDSMRAVSFAPLVLALIGEPVHGNAADQACQKWSAAYQAAVALAASGQYRAAERALRDAGGLAQDCGPHSREMALTLNSRGSVYQYLAMHTDAERCYRRALAIWEKLADGQAVGRIAIANNLARLYLETDQLGAAKKVLWHELAVSLGAAPEADLELARTHEMISVVFHKQRKYSQAEPHIRKAIELCESAVGPAHPETAMAWNDLGALEMAIGRHAESIVHLSKALSLLESALNGDHVGKVTTLSNLGLAYAMMQQPAASEPLLQRALRIAEAGYGPADARTAAVLSAYAEALRKLGKKREARDLQKRSQEIQSESVRRSRSSDVVSMTDLRNRLSNRRAPD